MNKVVFDKTANIGGQTARCVVRAKGKTSNDFDIRVTWSRRAPSSPFDEVDSYDYGRLFGAAQQAIANHLGGRQMGLCDRISSDAGLRDAGAVEVEQVQGVYVAIFDAKPLAQTAASKAA
jgi:hypothetical protein